MEAATRALDLGQERTSEGGADRESQGGIADTAGGDLRLPAAQGPGGGELVVMGMFALVADLALA